MRLTLYVKGVKKLAETEKQQPRAREPVVREKETAIIKEKEIIYKVKCPYCGKLYNKVLDVRLHCGKTIGWFSSIPFLFCL